MELFPSNHLKEIIATEERTSEHNDISLRNWGGHVLTSFFGTCQENNEGGKCQFKERWWYVEKRIGRDLLPIRSPNGW